MSGTNPDPQIDLERKGKERALQGVSTLVPAWLRLSLPFQPPFPPLLSEEVHELPLGVIFPWQMNFQQRMTYSSSMKILSKGSFIHSFQKHWVYLLGARSWDIQQCTNTAPSPGQPLGYREGTESPAWVRANLGVLNPRSLRNMTWALSKLQNLSWSHKTEIVIPASSDLGGSSEIMNSVPQHDIWKPPIGIQ